MQLELVVQNMTKTMGLPGRAAFRQWAEAALSGAGKGIASVTVRLVGAAESTRLNKRYRGKAGPTNVLSFSYDAERGLSGDIVICVPIVTKEAAAQNKHLRAHWAHLTVHGILHLRGFDHMTDKEARAMETLEIRILRRLGFPNPYLIP
jgi:probable rRNA maturation factor